MVKGIWNRGGEPDGSVLQRALRTCGSGGLRDVTFAEGGLADVIDGSDMTSENRSLQDIIDGSFQKTNISIVRSTQSNAECEPNKPET